jgi:putative transferase (TIGR04331 family)
MRRRARKLLVAARHPGATRGAISMYFNRFRDAGVLYYSPESAVKKVNEIFADPLSWWRSPTITHAVKAFRDQFAYTSERAIEKWAHTLRSLASADGL